ncbi:MAG: hypothetical protein IJ087_20030, partial [Eggerthellaceae bacterium]|nr:hypothetical protein [Eggerthellaceae bacterium]
MTKDKRQLRAEAVERLRDSLRKYERGEYKWGTVFDVMGIEGECSTDRVRALIDLLTDDDDDLAAADVESAKTILHGLADSLGTGCGTNGIQTDSPLVDELPGGDALAIMRECSRKKHGMATLRCKLGIECVAGWQMRCLGHLAVMAERDSVRREDCEAWNKL